MPQSGGVLADAAALERVGDHHDRRRDLDAIVERREQEGLGAAARFARAADPRDIHVGQRGQPVERPDAVPGLERGQAQAPVAQAIVQERVGERLAVVVADHVIQEDDAAQLGPSDAALLDLGIDPAVLPVAVRAEDARDLARRAGRPIEVAAEREAGERLEHDLLDRVAVAVELAVHLGIERRLREHRPEAQGHEHLLAEVRARSRQAAG